MLNLEDNKHLLYAVRIIFEKKEIDNLWESHKWVVNDLIPLNVTSGEGHPPINDVRIRPLINDAISKDDENKNLYVADASIDLHRAEAEGYAENLQSSDPSIYIVLRDGDLLDDNEELDNENNSIDVHLAEVSLSPYNIQDYEDCGEDKVEKDMIKILEILNEVEPLEEYFVSPNIDAKTKKEFVTKMSKSIFFTLFNNWKAPVKF